MVLFGQIRLGEARGQHSCREAKPPRSLSALKAGVTLPALNTSSWLWSGRRVAAGLTKTLQVFYRMS